MALKRTIILSVITCVVLSMLIAKDPVHAQSGSHEEAIDAAYREWVDVTNAKDIEKWASFLAPGAIFLPPDSPPLKDKKAITESYAELFTDERFSLDCSQETIEVSESGDLAWSTGRCAATFTDSKGLEGHGKSKWAKVWKRMPNGEWKCTLNSWSSTLPR